MADQLRWWKLWTASLTDPDLEGLSLDDWARWARLGAFTTLHGDHGVCPVMYPATALVESLRIGGRGGLSRHGQVWCWDTLIETLRKLPGIVVSVHGEGPQRCATITWKNWRKYQEDSSTERTRKWREEKRRRDGQTASRGDDHNTVTQSGSGDGQPASHVTVQTAPPLPGKPLPLSGISSQKHPTNGTDRRYPPEMFHAERDHGPCEVVPSTGRRWPPGTCVNRAWLAAHPDVTDFPCRSDRSPQTCEAHR